MLYLNYPRAFKKGKSISTVKNYRYVLKELATPVRMSFGRVLSPHIVLLNYKAVPVSILLNTEHS